ncbi:MAG: lipid-A-disaccharide synthase, partial [Alphaproteobacteria bacterium]|nr:lipid-A-disaccharide synthase [Alphaproteobacteria bacterium]
MARDPLVYLIAGEPSGDLLGARLMAALKEQAEGKIRFAGIGGEKMQAEGLKSLFPMNEISLMGFLEIVPHIPQLLRRIKETVNDIFLREPGVVITIDSPGFTFR